MKGKDENKSETPSVATVSTMSRKNKKVGVPTSVKLYQKRIARADDAIVMGKPRRRSTRSNFKDKARNGDDIAAINTPSRLSYENRKFYGPRKVPMPNFSDEEKDALFLEYLQNWNLEMTNDLLENGLKRGDDHFTFETFVGLASSIRVNVLHDICKRCGVPTYGIKREMAERIAEMTGLVRSGPTTVLTNDKSMKKDVLKVDAAAEKDEDARSGMILEPIKEHHEVENDAFHDDDSPLSILRADNSVTETFNDVHKTLSPKRGRRPNTPNRTRPFKLTKAEKEAVLDDYIGNNKELRDLVDQGERNELTYVKLLEAGDQMFMKDLKELCIKYDVARYGTKGMVAARILELAGIRSKPNRNERNGVSRPSTSDSLFSAGPRFKHDREGEILKLEHMLSMGQLTYQELSKRTGEDLKDILRDLNLKTSGLKDVLIHRILNWAREKEGLSVIDTETDVLPHAENENNMAMDLEEAEKVVNGPVDELPLNILKKVAEVDGSILWNHSDINTIKSEEIFAIAKELKLSTRGMTSEEVESAVKARCADVIEFLQGNFPSLTPVKPKRRASINSVSEGEMDIDEGDILKASAVKSIKSASLNDQLEIGSTDVAIDSASMIGTELNLIADVQEPTVILEGADKIISSPVITAQKSEFEVSSVKPDFDAQTFLDHQMSVIGEMSEHGEAIGKIHSFFDKLEALGGISKEQYDQIEVLVRSKIVS